MAHAHDALCVVDNTFATPYLQRPLEHGADIVSHSLTKYLGGHSDVVGGALITDDEALDEEIAFYQNSVGATPSPFDCFLVLRGTKTLPVRMDRHCENARTLAAWLADHDAVSEVYYPGLERHPQHELAAAQSCRSSSTAHSIRRRRSSRRRTCSRSRSRWAVSRV
jgi:cystathionine beta-lyase/cystathionine gamma-synthase